MYFTHSKVLESKRKKKPLIPPTTTDICLESQRSIPREREDTLKSSSGCHTGQPSTEVHIFTVSSTVPKGRSQDLPLILLSNVQGAFIHSTSTKTEYQRSQMVFQDCVASTIRQRERAENKKILCLI